MITVVFLSHNVTKSAPFLDPGCREGSKEEGVRCGRETTTARWCSPLRRQQRGAGRRQWSPHRYADQGSHTSDVEVGQRRLH